MLTYGISLTCSMESKEIPYVSMESKKLHTLEWKVRNYMRQHEQQQVMF
jgi:S-ribosylhomocysteine lyase LuxS involved in autoinducer biosynthesis